jgi:DNA invertase Pin-like site-specific DNA recombinase
MISAAIYARFSTDRQDSRSIDDQLRRCHEYAARNGYSIVGEYTDAAVSGTHTQRAQLQKLLAAAESKAKPFTAVIVDDLSRLSRDIGETHKMIFGTMAGAGVKLLDTSGLDSESDSGEMTIAMKSIVNREYIRNVSRQTHRGLDGRARAGFSTGGSLYGYRTVAEQNPTDAEHVRKSWQVDESEATVVRGIFTAFLDRGLGYRAIADELNRTNVAAPRNNGRGGKHGGGWSHVTVRSILINEKYVGRWVWNTHRWVSVPGQKARRRIKRPDTEHVTSHMPELAIIDAATWDRVASGMKKRKQGEQRTTRKGQIAYLTSGLLRCGTCSGPLSVCSAKVKAGVRYVNFGCTAHSSRGGSICDNGTTVSEAKINTALIAALKELLAKPTATDAFVRAFAKLGLPAFCGHSLSSCTLEFHRAHVAQIRV